MPPGYSGTHPKDELTEKDGLDLRSRSIYSWSALQFECPCFVIHSCLSRLFAVGTDVTLAAISPLSDLTEFVQFNLSFRRQHVRMVAHIIKFCSIIQALWPVIGRRDFEEFTPIVRP